MKYYSIKKTEILYLKLIWKIKNLQPIEKEDLKYYLTHEAQDKLNKVMLLGNLLYCGHPKYSKQYLLNILTIFYELFEDYSPLEKQYIYLYLFILMASKNIEQYYPEICNYYLSLPKINDDNLIINQLENQMRFPLLWGFRLLNYPIQQLSRLFDEELQ